MQAAAPGEAVEPVSWLRTVRRGSIATSAVLGFAARGGEVACKFLLQLEIARHLGADGSGTVFLALSIVSIAATVARAGLDVSLTMHLARNTGLAYDGRQEADGGAWIGSGVLLTAAGSLALALMLALAAPTAARLLFHAPVLAEPLRLMMAGIPGMALLAVLVGILNGAERPVLGQMFGGPLWPLLALGFAFFARTAAAANAALAAAMLLAALIGFLLLAAQGQLAHCRFSVAAATTLLRTGWSFFVIDGVQVTLISLPTLILGAFRTPAEVGVFSLASRISLVLTVVLIVMAGIGAPKVAIAHAHGDASRMQSVTGHLLALALLAAAPAFMLLLGVPGLLLSLFGPGFAGGGDVLRVLALGQFAGILFCGGPTALEMTGHGPVLRRLNVLALILCVALCLVLTPVWGGTGTAWATSLTLFAYYGAAAWKARRLLGVDCTPLCLLPSRAGR
jgi:O-antigen/teichoic acid export membrane protein